PEMSLNESAVACATAPTVNSATRMGIRKLIQIPWNRECYRIQLKPHGERRSVNDLVRARGQRGRQSDAERFRSRQVDDQLDFRGLLDVKFTRLLAFEDAPYIDAGLTERLGRTVAITHQAARRGEWAILIDRRHHIAQRQSRKTFAVGIE